MNTECYKILSFSEIEERLSTHSISVSNFDTVLSSNHALIYYLKSGEVVLLPNDFSNKSKGLLFLNKECLMDCIKEDSFPIENTNMRIEEKYKSIILNISEKISPIVERLYLVHANKANYDINNMSSLSDLFLTLKKKKNCFQKKIFSIPH